MIPRNVKSVVIQDETVGGKAVVIGITKQKTEAAAVSVARSSIESGGGGRFGGGGVGPGIYKGPAMEVTCSHCLIVSRQLNKLCPLIAKGK